MIWGDFFVPTTQTGIEFSRGSHPHDQFFCISMLFRGNAVMGKRHKSLANPAFRRSAVIFSFRDRSIPSMVLCIRIKRYSSVSAAPDAESSLPL